jgi:hypothetical protein
MSEHTPTILELTPSPHAPQIVASKVIDLMERKYIGKMKIIGGRPPDDVPLAIGSIVLGSYEVFLDIQFVPNIQDTCIAIELSSKAYEGAYDVFRRRVLRGGRRALIDFCIAVAGVVAAEGFRLRFHEGPVRRLAVEDIVRGLTLVDSRAGLINGIAMSSTALSSVRRRYPNWIESKGYAVLAFI